MIRVEKVASRADLNRFITTPRRLYKGFSDYIPPLDMDRRMLLDPKKSAFFELGKATYFLAWRGKDVVGRISAHIDGLASGPFHADAASFGCLDAIDDPDVVAALLRAAEIWARSQKKTLVRGPFSLSINAESGLQVFGQDEKPMVMMPWHPSYLEAHVQKAGYGQVKLLHSYQIVLEGFDYSAFAKRTGLDRMRAKISVRGLDMKNFEADTEIGRQLFNDAWAENWGFVPLSRGDMKELSDNFKMFLHEDYAVVCEYQGEPVGFALAIPNVMEVAADLGPNPGPFGLMQLAYRLFMQKNSTARIVMFGISRKYRNGALGAMIAAAIMDRLMRNGLKHKMEMIEAGWVLEDNAALNRILELFGFRRVRSYAMYERLLEQS